MMTAPGLVVARQECADLWRTGRGPLLLLLFSVLLSVVTYLTSTNQALNFLEQREAVNLVVQLAMAVGVLVTMVVSGDALSGERERGTLESLLLTPVSRRAILAGKLTAALSLWLGAFLVSIPYIWILARGVGIMPSALGLDALVGTAVAAGLGSIGLLISVVSNSNKTSLAASLFLLIALFAPTQLPSGLPQGWFFEVLLRLNPVASGLTYVSSALVGGHPWTRDLSYLVSPLLSVVLAGGALALAGPRLLQLTAGRSAR
jgi:ABC-2 type transport system permease protein